MLDDFDLDFSDEEESQIEEEGGGSNRTFIMVAGGLGALLVISMLCIGGYILLNRPQQPAQDQPATNTALAILTATSQSQTQTALALIPTSTSLQSPTASPPFTETPTATDTPGGVTDTPEVPTITPGGPTADPRTATVQALLTQAAIAQTQAAGAILTVSPTPTALPDTGFIDDVGAPALFGLASMLLMVIFVARRLREANA